MNVFKRYEDMRKFYDHQTPWRGTDDRPWGKRQHSNKRMRMDAAGSIEIEYQKHAFAIWHADGTVEISGFGGPQQQTIWQHLLPYGVIFDETYRIGSVALSAPVKQMRVNSNGSYKWVYFPHRLRDEDASNRWQGSLRYGSGKINPDVIVFRTDERVRMHYCAKRGMWLPADEGALKPFQWQEIDKRKTRAINDQYRLTDFDAYLKAVNTLSEMPKWAGEVTDDQLLNLIQSGDFTTAMEHFPRQGHNHSRWYMQNNPAYLDDKPPAYSYFNNLRTQLYKDHGCLIERAEKIIAQPVYKRIQGLLYRFSGS